MTDQTSKSFLQDLWDRRFFQFVGSYLAVSFGILQFGQFVERRYDLEVMLVEKLFLFLIVMLPVFVIFIYNHGRPGDDKWLPHEKILVPVSFVIAFASAIFLFNSPMSAATAMVSITNEEGETIERLVPTMSNTKRLVIFPFTNNTGDPAYDWMKAGGSYLMDKDIEQDMRIFATQALSLKLSYEEYNQKFLDEIPFSTQIKIAQDYYSDCFVTASLGKSEDGLSLKAAVYDSKNGQELYIYDFDGSNIFELIDLFSSSLEESFFPKESGTSFSHIDLPVSNLVSQNVEALKLYIEGSLIRIENPSNSDAAIEKLQKAIEIDPACAECYRFMTRLYLDNADVEKGKQAIEKAVQLSGTLPERQQLEMGLLQFRMNDEIEKSIQLLENWRKLYPNDLTPYLQLIQIYRISFRLKEAKEVGLDALSKGHKGTLIKELAELHIATEDYDEAEKYLEEFARLYPHKSREIGLLGDVYVSKGSLKEAKKVYSDLLLLEPNNTANLVKLADVEDRMGNFDEALKVLESALKRSNQIQDSISAYTAIEKHWERLGKYRLSFEIAENRERLMGKILAPVIARNNMFFTNDVKLLVIGKKEEYLRKKAEILQVFPQNAVVINCVGDFLYNLIGEDSAGLDSTKSECLDLLQQSGGGNWSLLMQAVKDNLSGNYKEAAKNYETYIDSTGAGAKAFSYKLSEVYRNSGQLNKAKELIDKLILEDPSQPIILVEAARVYLANKDKKKAKIYYVNAMEIWADADEDLSFYQEALPLKKDLGME